MKRTKTTVPWPMIAVVIVVVIAGCGKADDGPARASSGNGNLKATVGGSGHLAWGPAWTANGLGLWREEGLDVEVVNFASGREATTAVLGGRVDFATIAETPAVTAAIQGQPIKIVANVSTYEKYRMITLASNGIAGFDDLRGKTIAVPVGTNAEYAAHVALNSVGLTKDDVKIVNTSNGDLIAALNGGDVDAVFGFPPIEQEAIKALGDEYRDVIVDGYTAQGLIVASDEVATEEPELVKRLTAGLIAAEKAMSSQPLDKIQSVVAKNSSESLESIKGEWKDFDFRVALQRSLIDEMVAQGQWAKSTGLVPEAGDASLFTSYLQAGPLRSVDSSRVDSGLTSDTK